MLSILEHAITRRMAGNGELTDKSDKHCYKTEGIEERRFSDIQACRRFPDRANSAESTRIRDPFEMNRDSWFSRVVRSRSFIARGTKRGIELLVVYRGETRGPCNRTFGVGMDDHRLRTVIEFWSDSDSVRRVVRNELENFKTVFDYIEHIFKRKGVAPYKIIKYQSVERIWFNF